MSGTHKVFNDFILKDVNNNIQKRLSISLGLIKEGKFNKEFKSQLLAQTAFKITEYIKVCLSDSNLNIEEFREEVLGNIVFAYDTSIYLIHKLNYLVNNATIQEKIDFMASVHLDWELTEEDFSRNLLLLGNEFNLEFLEFEKLKASDLSVKFEKTNNYSNSFAIIKNLHFEEKNKKFWYALWEAKMFDYEEYREYSLSDYLDLE